MSSGEKIDIVITWVDGSDSEWLKLKEQFEEKKGDNSVSRYRDWGVLKYWFRGIETYAPWVNNVFFVTWGHLPEWLNTNHPKLKIIKHEDYIPQEYLPTFSSRTIDTNFHRIPELSEHFVYFNDDMFIISPTTERDFFQKGLPCDTAVLNAHCLGYGDKKNKTRTTTNMVFTAPIFDTVPINRNFIKKSVINKNFFKWFSIHYGKEIIRTLLLSPWDAFPGFMDYHLPYSYLKSTYKEVWDQESEILDECCRHRFRTNTDVNHWVFTYWQFAKGNFCPRNPNIGKSYWLSSDKEKNNTIYNAIRKQKHKLICINDSANISDFEGVRTELIDAFEEILCKKSGFEK